MGDCYSIQLVFNIIHKQTLYNVTKCIMATDDVTVVIIFRSYTYCQLMNTIKSSITLDIYILIVKIDP